VGSRSLTPNKKILLQLLQWELGKGSRSSDQKGILIISSFFYCLLLIHRLPCRVPQDIPSASLAKNIPPESESPKVNNPLNPSAKKTLLETPNPPGSVDTNVPTGVASNLTSPPAADWRCDAANQSLRPDPTMHHDASPISSKSFELRAHARPQQGEGSSVPRLGKQPR
jgi:hypothetical protein